MCCRATSICSAPANDVHPTRLVRQRACSSSYDRVSYIRLRFAPALFVNRAITYNHSISEFKTGARYAAADGLTPGWSAAYDIESTDLFSDPKYTCLRANRSPREGALVVRLETLDRRTAETLEQTSAPPAAKDAPEFVVTIAEDEQPKEDLKVLSGIKGWRRSHRHKIYDSLKTGYQQEPQQNVAPKFVTIHGELSVSLNFPLVPISSPSPPAPTTTGPRVLSPAPC